LAVISADSLNIVTEGKLSTAFDIRQIDFDNFIDSINFSPDNHKLAFTTYNNEVVLVDIEKQIANKLCPDNNRVSYLGTVIWSPDSRFVILEMYLPKYREQFDLLIDTQEMKAYKLISGQYQHRLVWLAEP